MRLVLALAAHFKPGPSKIASPRPMEEIEAGSRAWLDRVAAAQEAVAALAEVRQDVAGVGQTAPCTERMSGLTGASERSSSSTKASRAAALQSPRSPERDAAGEEQ
ncbi:Dixin, partial [Ophiophagus hannah]